MTTTISDKDPVQRAKQVYLQEPCARSFEEDFYLHWNNPQAIVYKDASNLVFIRPVNILDSYEKLTDPRYETATPNAWWVYLFVGDFRFLIHHLPYQLQYIGWERNNKPRFYTLARLLKWTDHISILH